MKKPLALLAGVAAIGAFSLLGGCSMFGIRTYEEPKYTVLAEDGSFEVREYGELVIATTATEVENYDESGSKGFKRLGGYIFGKNRVAGTDESEGISMTAPVIQERADDAWTMAFVMPAEHSMDSLPVPLDPTVEFVTIPARTVAAVRYSGLVSEETIEEYTAKLSEWLTERGYEAVSPPRSARYDPPWAIPFLRRNEVLIDVATPTVSSLPTR
jgi:effector-binding domain-containing protein